ncbi:unnamed protein product [Linum trigynum]|uniref:Replication factor-A protein 1 N-terminal domain-containing protein n=1 Tax=Linum trigynum TaxID=586398 RepID=A0AAV2FIA3_9ROSI
MSASLTPNAVELISRSEVSSSVVVQVVEIDKLSSSPETFRLLISDSVNAVWAVLTPKMNEKFNKGDVIQITDYKLGERE